MHQCLSTLDVLSHIFEYVYTENSGLKDTAALAVTCQAFREPALDILWRSLPSLRPLVRCLPTDAYGTERDSYGVMTVVRRMVASFAITQISLCKVPTRELVDEDFHRFKSYVHRVRHIGRKYPEDDLSWMMTGRWYLEESFYDSLEQHGIIPLHQLRSYAGRGWIDFVTFHHIIGPRVVEVAFSGWYSSKPRFFRSRGGALVVSLSPSLRVLRFYGEHGFDLSSLYLALLEGVPHLEVLYAPTSDPLPDDVLGHILSSSVLKDLEVGNLPVDFARCMPSRTPLRLQHFGLKIVKMERCDEVLASLDMSRLQSIKVHYSDEVEFPLVWQVQSWFEMVPAYCSTSLLTKIEYDGPWNYLPVDAGEEYCITMQTLEPLLQFRNLEELVITSPTGFHLDDESLSVFARSWPRMRRLDLNSRYIGWSDIGDYDISLDGLVILAESWPNLEHLNLCLTARGDSVEDSIQDVHSELEKFNLKGAVGCWKLKSLGVGWDSPVVYRPFVVAAFLHGIFPNLSTILGLESPDFAESLPGEWKDVEEVLRYLIGLRERTMRTCHSARP